MDDIDNQLRRLFETAAAQVEFPVEDMAAVGTRLGRKRRARRNGAVAAAAVCVVGLTAGVVIGVQRLGIGSARSGTATAGPYAADQPVSVGSGPATAHPSTPADPNPSTNANAAAGGAASPGSSGGGSATAAVPLDSGLVSSTPDSGPQVGASLLTQLVSGQGLHAVRQSSSSIGVADLIYDDGHGQSEISASVRAYTATLSSWHAYTCVNFSPFDEGRRPAGAPAPSCTKVTTTDGNVEYVVVTTDDGSGFYDYEVDLYTGDNMVVALAAGNGVPQATTVDVTRAVPPLSLAEMQAIVADPAWLDFIDPTS